jgi:hypothetical protein
MGCPFVQRPQYPAGSFSSSECQTLGLAGKISDNASERDTGFQPGLCFGWSSMAWPSRGITVDMTRGRTQAVRITPSSARTGQGVSFPPAQGPPTQVPLSGSNTAPCQPHRMSDPSGVR